jgi:hypothetical protein
MGLAMPDKGSGGPENPRKMGEESEKASRKGVWTLRRRWLAYFGIV